MIDSARVGKRISSFEAWLRTGRRHVGNGIGRIEYKFNGWHDPEDGEFTQVGAGRYFPPGSSTASSRVRTQRQTPQPKAASSSATGRSPRRGSGAPKAGPAISKVAAVPPLPYLSSTHNEIRQLASKHSPKPGTEEWTPIKASRYYAGREDVHAFKAQWVRGYRDAIVAAARKDDLPVELLAGVAYNEVGGAPLQADEIAYSLRSEEGRNLPPAPKLEPPRDLTSFGDLSVQVRRASESLGYGSVLD